MPPIPVHIDDPITPQKAQGATPQTIDAPPPVGVPANNNTPTTTQDASSSPAYPPARPGAAAVPAPTPYIPPQPTRTMSLQRNENAPPPPQPGAVPMPSNRQGSVGAALPPPPKAGERKTSAGMNMGMPSQVGIPPPGLNYAPTRSTTTTGAAYQQAAPSTLNMGPVSAQHPPGYRQNSYAQDLNPTQRSSIEEQERRESLVPGIGGGGGRGSGAMNWEGGNEAVGNMWSTVKGWVGVAGEKLAETEETVWKRINGQ